MITIKDFMECVEYKISDGYEYQWSCYGSNARGLSYTNEELNDSQVTICIVFDTQDQTVYEMQAWDGPNRVEYRWIHPDYIDSHIEEAAQRNVNWEESFDDHKFVDLEVSEDMLEKASAIYNGVDYDTRIIVPLDLNKEDQYQLMKMAHEHDMTLNDFVADILRETIEGMV